MDNNTNNSTNTSESASIATAAKKETSNKKPNPTSHLDEKYPTKRGFIGVATKNIFLLLSSICINMKCVGKENFPDSNPYVVASNHQSYPDGVWIIKYLPKGHFKYMCCLAASDLETEHGLIGKIIMKVGRGIAVDRYGNPVRGLIKAKKEVEAGDILFVFPEGTRTSDGNLNELKDGASYVAIKASVPLVPIYISGAYDIWPRQSKKPHFFKGFLKRNKMRIIVGKPLYGADYDNDAHKMTEALSVWMHEMQDKYKDPEKVPAKI